MTDERRQIALAVWLAAIAGFVDAVGFLVLHRIFVAHMTGNTNQVGQRLGRGDAAGAAPVLVAVASFVVSIAIVTIGLEAASRRHARSPTALALALEAVLLTIFMVYGSYALVNGAIPGGHGGFYLCIVVVVAAMGAQTACVTSWGKRTVRTTYISGMLTRLGQEAAGLLLGPGPRRAAWASTGAYLSLWLAFVCGGAVGALALGRYDLWSLALPVGALLAAAATDWWKPAYGRRLG